MKLIILLAIFSSQAFAGPADLDYLKAEDQKYFRNDINDGNNQVERISINVKEINKLHAEIASMKADMLQMRAEIEELKKKK
jgi:peptidoglycan hydrolase CwlO-like protein